MHLATYSPPVIKKLSVATAPATSTIMNGAAQIYGGQWEEDKRHGHGVKTEISDYARIDSIHKLCFKK